MGLKKKTQRSKDGAFHPKDTAKLIFFENLFYMLDSDSNGLIAMEDPLDMARLFLGKSPKEMIFFVFLIGTSSRNGWFIWFYKGKSIYKIL